MNNAALYYDIDNFDPSYEYLQKVTAVNQHGAWLMTRAAAPVMAKQQYGRVINQSSGAAYAYIVPGVRRRVHRPRQLQLLDHEVGHRRAHEVHGRAARAVEHHGELHRARA